MYNFKKDTYQKARGGTSRVLDITCGSCQAHVAFYQKDGPGILKRMYIDRFIDTKPSGPELACPTCGHILGTRITYKKENRAAYRLFVGAVHKKIVRRGELGI